jgi:hypothetical protein
MAAIDVRHYRKHQNKLDLRKTMSQHARQGKNWRTPRAQAKAECM